MEHWSKLKGQDLDRYIYERQGYQIVDVNAATDGIKVRTLSSLVVISPNMVGNWPAIRDTDFNLWAIDGATAWTKFLMANTLSSHTDNALNLLNSLPDDCTPRLVRILTPPIGYQWKAGIISSQWDTDVDQFDKSASLAACRAWCEWDERTNQSA